jgi:hypothetical protein
MNSEFRNGIKIMDACNYLVIENLDKEKVLAPCYILCGEFQGIMEKSHEIQCQRGHGKSMDA